MGCVCGGGGPVRPHSHSSRQVTNSCIRQFPSCLQGARRMSFHAFLGSLPKLAEARCCSRQELVQRLLACEGPTLGCAPQQGVVHRETAHGQEVLSAWCRPAAGVPQGHGCPPSLRILRHRLPAFSRATTPDAVRLFDDKSNFSGAQPGRLVAVAVGRQLLGGCPWRLLRGAAELPELKHSKPTLGKAAPGPVQASQAAGGPPSWRRSGSRWRACATAAGGGHPCLRRWSRQLPSQGRLPAGAQRQAASTA